MTKHRHIYISPHLDDVALSCGGRIHQLTQAGESVLVVTVFAASPTPDGGKAAQTHSSYIAALHQRWQAGTDAPALRRTEDEAAVRVLGANLLHLDDLDCIYRSHPVTDDLLYISDKHIFGPVHPSDFMLAAALQNRLEGLVDVPGNATFYSPLAAGHHVDHQIAVAATLALQAGGHRVIFYEDYPYSESPEALAAARAWIGGKRWQEELLPLRPQDLTIKAKAVCQYRSQLSTFFQDDAEVVQRLNAYAKTAAPNGEYGERIWHLTK